MLPARPQVGALCIERHSHIFELPAGGLTKCRINDYFPIRDIYPGQDGKTFAKSRGRVFDYVTCHS
jgi:hypothetical protein